MLEVMMGPPGSDSLAELCIGITAGLAVGLPAMRWYAGVRGNEPVPSRRAATLRSGVAMLAWLVLTAALAGKGVLANFDRFPPPVMPVVLASFALTFVLAFSRFGERLARDLPLALLVGYQGFRVVVEIMLHEAGDQGVIGQQMTWSGFNFDVVTGLTALVLGVWLWRRDPGKPQPRALLWAWNLLGLGLLFTIVMIAILSMPTPLRQFDGPPNVFVGYFPFVWLPTVMVTAALFGHLLMFRRLLAIGRSPTV
ncbi:hypothetical protein DB30_02090 [Enhygromyxa salina]|uniref:Uncharacterized protein n=1 Tax=Enhygromyxa salina TaxID=215803 RepID=A0A0C2CQN8_9BACT|nr:hypothetical protein [Enhygromyxa salina]KIG12035.1 hypothetical protein DB30_02090 [Enhygromyxa salina]